MHVPTQDSLLLFTGLPLLIYLRQAHPDSEQLTTERVEYVISLMHQAITEKNYQLLDLPELKDYIQNYQAAAHKLVAAEFARVPLKL